MKYVGNGKVYIADDNSEMVIIGEHHEKKVNLKSVVQNQEKTNSFNVVLKNDGTYTNKCINIPVIDKRNSVVIDSAGIEVDKNRDVVIGFISAVNQDFVTATLWGRYIHKEILEDGTPCSIEICS